MPAGARPCGRDDALRQGRRLTFADQGALELCDGTENLEDEHASCGGGVDAFGQRHQLDAAFLKVFGRGDQLLQRAVEAVELPHDQHVAAAQHVVEDARQLGPVPFGSRGLLGVDLLAAGTPERVELQLAHERQGREGLLTSVKSMHRRCWGWASSGCSRLVRRRW